MAQGYIPVTSLAGDQKPVMMLEVADVCEGGNTLPRFSACLWFVRDIAAVGTGGLRTCELRRGCARIARFQ